MTAQLQAAALKDIAPNCSTKMHVFFTYNCWFFLCWLDETWTYGRSIKNWQEVPNHLIYGDLQGLRTNYTTPKDKLTNEIKRMVEI